MIEKAKAGFIYKFECIRPDGTVRWEEEVHNLLPNESVAYILGAALASGSQLGTWYIGLFESAHTPAVTDTMTTAVSTAVESVAYSGTSRLTMTPDAITSGVFSNSSTPVEFTFTGPATIRGGFITSNILRGNTAGMLLSIVSLSSAKTMVADEILKVTAGMSLATI